MSDTTLFRGFEPADFAAFSVERLEPRMEAIRARIQPKFHALGAALRDELAMLAKTEMFVHIAKHARRKVNPPVDTWMAFCHSKRGYKMFPHFQIGLFDDRVFLWLAYVYDLPDKRKIADRFLERIGEVHSLVPADYRYSFDHIKKDSTSAADVGESELRQALERFRSVKKEELLIGRVLPADEPLLRSGPQFVALAKQTFAALMPLYLLSV